MKQRKWRWRKEVQRWDRRGTSPQFPSYCVTNSHGMLIGRQRERSTGHVARSIRLSAIVDLTRIGNLGQTDRQTDGQTDLRLLVPNVQTLTFGHLEACWILCQVWQTLPVVGMGETWNTYKILVGKHAVKRIFFFLNLSWNVKQYRFGRDYGPVARHVMTSTLFIMYRYASLNDGDTFWEMRR